MKAPVPQRFCRQWAPLLSVDMRVDDLGQYKCPVKFTRTNSESHFCKHNLISESKIYILIPAPPAELYNEALTKMHQDWFVLV